MNSTTLTTFWVDEGQLIQTAPTMKNEVKAEIVNYYKENGLESLAKEAGILDPNGELAGCRNQKAKTTVRPPVAMPVLSATTAAAASKMSPYKTEPAILPRIVQVGTSPMILSSPQRGSATGHLLGSSPRTPGLSPLVDGQGNWTAKRLHEYSDGDYGDSKRFKKNEKGGKGLRHFSMKVCEKVQKKGTTSYNEVADELVAEFSDPVRSMSPTEHGSDSQAYDQKNIRRRVYDALNVLMAMSIISKEKKEIRWLGLPTNSAQECQNLEAEKQKRLDRIASKSQQLQELIIQQVAFKSLVQRNKQQEKSHGAPMQNSMIQLPFIIVNTSKKTTIDCSISSDKTEYLFDFDNTFEIHDDIEVLKRMGMSLALEKGSCNSEDLEKARQMVPKSLESYVLQMAKEGGIQSGKSTTTTTNNNCNAPSAGPSNARPAPTSLLNNTNVVVKNSTSNSAVAAPADASDGDSLQRAPSRQSSIASISDNMPSQPDSATDDDFSDSDSEHSSNLDVN